MEGRFASFSPNEGFKMGSAEDAFRRSVREHLSKLEPALVAALGQLVKYRYPKEVHALAFEVFSDGFTSEFPVRAYFMDSSNCEFFVHENGVTKYPSPISPDLLDVDRVYPAEMEETLTASDPGLDPWSIATSELIDWFHSCWTEAGGRNFSLAATIAPHDSTKAFNLKSGQWQQDNAGSRSQQ